MRGDQNNQTVLKRKNKLGRVKLPNIKASNKTIVNKTGGANIRLDIFK
jgi:hypothetical protein